LNFDLGCLVDNNLLCYNDLVNEHLKENDNVDITQLIK